MFLHAFLGVIFDLNLVPPFVAHCAATQMLHLLAAGSSTGEAHSVSAGEMCLSR